ncbi:MAG: hypothetical protein U0798_06865 [Gemmataceae bacterium]
MNTRTTRAVEIEEQRRIDSEFIADFRAGRIPELNPTPFGEDMTWLNTPARPFDAAVSSLINLPKSDWMEVGGPDLRTAALGEGLAGGTDEQVYQRWAENQFLALCLAEGEDGQELLNSIRTEPLLDNETLDRVVVILESVPRFAALSLDQRVAAALLTVEALKPKSAKA